MLKQNGNIRIKIFRNIFAAVNLTLISGGLVSCTVEVPQPPAAIEQQKPVLQPTQQPKQKDKNDDDDKHSDRKDNKNDDDND